MMRLLVFDVFTHRFTMTGANSENCITLLPCEIAIEFLCSPNRGILFQIANKIRETMCCLQTHEKMNMILYTANSLGDSTLISDNPARIGVEAITPFEAD